MSPDPDGTKSTYHIGVLDKAFLILRSVADEPKTANELAASLQLNWNTVYRIVRNLEEKGVLTQVDGKRYAVNLQVFQLGAQLREAALIDVARPVMTSLAAATEESAFLSIRQGLRATVIHRVESPHPLRLSSPVGSSRPLHAGAMGKLLLSFAPDEVVQQLLRTPLDELTDNTTTEPTTLRDELRGIRERGAAVSDGENTFGSSAVAAPIRDASASVVAALSIGGPTERVGLRDQDWLVDTVCRHADRLSQLLASTSRV